MARNASPLPEWSLSDRLRKIRRDRHLTQDEFARRLGIKAVTYAAWEAGRNRPDDVVHLATTVESVFGVPAAWTLGVLHGRRSDDRPHAALSHEQLHYRVQPNVQHRLPALA